MSLNEYSPAINIDIHVCTLEPATLCFTIVCLLMYRYYCGEFMDSYSETALSVIIESRGGLGGFETR